MFPTCGGSDFGSDFTWGLASAATAGSGFATSFGGGLGGEAATPPVLGSLCSCATALPLNGLNALLGLTTAAVVVSFPVGLGGEARGGGGAATFGGDAAATAGIGGSAFGAAAGVGVSCFTATCGSVRTPARDFSSARSRRNMRSFSLSVTNVDSAGSSHRRRFFAFTRASTSDTSFSQRKDMFWLCASRAAFSTEVTSCNWVAISMHRPTLPPFFSSVSKARSMIESSRASSLASASV
mmetsp:Transcript_10443/g.32389  ORF Transcript_10443/g.32389 Transcript_10443/m.32389 type:complete len:239 (+) Transcript_10443:292-1008(+)